MNNVTGGNASVTEGSGTIVGNPTYAGKVMTINLSNVSNGQTIGVTMNNVTDTFGQTLPPTTVRMSVAMGDSTGNGVVTSSDIAQIKANIGLDVTQTNFRSDVTANGVINSSDVAAAKTAIGGGTGPAIER
jgi:hypothetical protein